jgi:hypothetical protein
LKDIRAAIPLALSSSSVFGEQWQVQWDPFKNKPWNSSYSSEIRRTDDASGKVWKNVWLPSSMQSVDDLSMEAFISHLQYTERGSYCIISWNINETNLQAPTTATQMCLPVAFLRRMQATM